MWGDIAIAFLLAFITAFVITPYTIRLAKKVGGLDIPKDNRRMHHKPMPKLRRNSCYYRILSFRYLLTNYFFLGRNSFFIWRRKLWGKITRIFVRYFGNRSYLLH